VDPILSSLTIFFPCYNDEGTIVELVRDALSVGYDLTDDLEVVVIDDGSVDGSRRLLEGLRGRHPEFKLICHEKNRGYGAALRSGFEAATKAWVFYTDGDGQYDVNDLPDLVSEVGGCDVVNGHKMRRADGWHRRVVGNLYATTVRKVFVLPIRDIDCDFRLIRTDLVKRLVLESDSGSVCVELISKLADLGAVFAEVPVPHYARRFGTSQFFQFSRIVRTILQLISLYQRRSS
jgi:glycosyltransferase involved in cell wall biosynthesis